MELIQPAFGLIFWQTITFLVVLLILSKYGWKPILSIIKEREYLIQKAISQAKEAQQLTTSAQEAQQKILKEVDEKRDSIIAEAMAEKIAILADADKEASKHKEQLLVKAKEAIAQEKEVAFNLLKGQAAVMGIQIAEKLLKKELQYNNAQQELLNHLIDGA